MKTEVEIITPALAKQYLAKNKNNRAIKERTLSMLVRAIKDGSFALTHQGIAFDEEGNLIDGQHRLMACVIADIPIKVLVSREVKTDAVQFVDIGVKRDFADVIKMTGRYEDSPALRNKGTSAAMKQLVYYGYNTGIKLSILETCELLEYFRIPCEQVYKASISRKSATSYVNAAAMAALICGESYDDIFNFFSVFSNGDSKNCEEYNIAAAFNWRQQIMDAKVRRMDFKPNKLFFGTQNAIWNFIHSDAKTIKMPKQARYPVYKIFDLYFAPHGGKELQADG